MSEIKIAKGESNAAASRKTNNGKSEVASILLSPVSVDKENMEATVIAEGYQKKDAVFTK